MERMGHRGQHWGGRGLMEGAGCRVWEDVATAAMTFCRDTSLGRAGAVLKLRSVAGGREHSVAQNEGIHLESHLSLVASNSLH